MILRSRPAPDRKTILITGASSGLGEGMARAYAARGKSLALCARRLDRLQALADELEPTAATVAVAPLDVTEPDAVAAVFADLDAQLGGLDRVIVNAGLGKGAPLGTGKPHANLATATTNFIGALAQAEAALALFRERGAGHLVLVSSMSAVHGLPKAQAAYSASKAGVSALGQGLAVEFARSPITISVVLPGYIATDINAGVTTTMMTDYDTGVAAMVEAIDSERERVVVPTWPWAVVDKALRFLPEPVVRRLI